MTTWNIFQLFFFYILNKNNQKIIKMWTKIRKNNLNRIKLNQFCSHFEEYSNERTRCRLSFMEKNLSKYIKNNRKILRFVDNILVSILTFRFCKLRTKKMIYRNRKKTSDVIAYIFLWNSEYLSKKVLMLC